MSGKNLEAGTKTDAATKPPTIKENFFLGISEFPGRATSKYLSMDNKHRVYADIAVMHAVHWMGTMSNIQFSLSCGMLTLKMCDSGTVMAAMRSVADKMKYMRFVWDRGIRFFI